MASIPRWKDHVKGRRREIEGRRENCKPRQEVYVKEESTNRGPRYDHRSDYSNPAVSEEGENEGSTEEAQDRDIIEAEDEYAIGDMEVHEADVLKAENEGANIEWRPLVRRRNTYQGLQSISGPSLKAGSKSKAQDMPYEQLMWPDAS